ncbi:fimbria/pilus periplasmic chaperone [Escherichia coli]
MSEKIKKIFIIFMLHSSVAIATTNSVPYPIKTRVIVHEGLQEKTANLVVKNPGERVWLLQSWIEDIYGKRYSGIYPVLSRIEPNTNTRLLIYPPKELWIEDKESIAWLNIRIIPATFLTKENRLTIPIEYKLKLFLRPSSVPLELTPQIRCFNGDNYIALKNIGKNYLILNHIINLKGEGISTNTFSIPPGDTMTTSVPYIPGQYDISYINDYGLTQSIKIYCS